MGNIETFSMILYGILLGFGGKHIEEVRFGLIELSVDRRS